MEEASKASLIRGCLPGSEAACCKYAMTNRYGGQGRGNFSSNNMSFDVGDVRDVVLANRRHLKSQLNLHALLSAHQNHGTEVFCLKEQLHDDLEVNGYDALVTDQVGIGLMVQQADCQAVLLFDPRQKVIAAIHCGWRGSVQNILAETVAVMVEEYGTIPPEVHGVISPSLGPCCAEFVNYKDELPSDFLHFMVRQDYFDFWKISKNQLSVAGVNSKNIDVIGNCTSCSTDYFSYRKACQETAGITGRNSSVVYLQDR